MLLQNLGQVEILDLLLAVLQARLIAVLFFSVTGYSDFWPEQLPLFEQLQHAGLEDYQPMVKIMYLQDSDQSNVDRHLLFVGLLLSVL